MNERARFRALRFVHPDVAGDAAGGLRLSPRVGFEMVAEDDSIRQAILLLLSTVPGERVMRPTYGCLLHRVVFSPNDDTTAGLAIHYVRQALEWWELRIDVLDVDAQRNPADPGRLDLTLVYRVKATLKLDRIELPVQLSGEEVA